MTDTVLRGCTVKDLETVCEIERQCFSVPWSKESFVSVLASPDSDLLLLTSAQDSIYGFGCVISVAGEAEILNIAVSPAHRRNGYGAVLLEALLKKAGERGAQQIFLEVRESNTAARQLYEKYGFQPIGKRKRYYTNPTEDAVCMCCILSGSSQNEE